MAPKSKANGAGAKPEKSVPSTSGTATPITDAPSSGALTKPDKAAYDAEQDSLRKQIDAIQTKLAAVKEKISNGGRDEASNTRQKELKSQLDELKGHQATNKSSRGRLLDQIQALNDGVNKKIKDLNAARGKVPYKTVGEIDNRVQQLEKQVESGSMKISDEKRALAEIQSLKRSRRNVESFQKEQDAIDADREQANAIRAQLDDPEYKAVFERYEAIKKELDSLRDEADIAYNSRNKLFDERNGYQAELDTLFGRKRELTQTYRETQDRYYAKVQEDRARRAERARVQRAEEEAEKKKAAVERIREEASIPAFQAQIEDCQTLIDYFSGKTNSAPVTNAGAALAPRKEIAGVAQHEARTVDAVPEGVIVRKKKGEDEDTYFAGKAKKGGKNKKADAPVKEDGKLNLPLSTLSALLSMSIPPPVVPGDFPRVAEDLKTKKSWFEANQSRITSENMAKAESEIARILGKHANGVAKPTSTPSDITPANGGGEKPAEPASTPALSDAPSVPVPSDEVVDKLESVAEDEA